jgi:hypothetical protein
MQIGISKYHFLRTASQQGFITVEVIPYQIVHPLLAPAAVPFVPSIAFIFEHAPLLKSQSYDDYIHKVLIVDDNSSDRTADGNPRYRGT